MYIPSTGFFLNNRLALFYLDPKEPNVLAPRKRPRMTLNPVLVMKEGKPFMVFGTPGGDTMPQSQLQFFLNFSEFGMNVQQAVEQPYVVTSAFRGALWPHAIPNKLMVSERIAESVRAGLGQLGHNVDTHAAKGVGSVKAILIDPRTGVLMGGAAPATDSYVIGW
jgi:gamma-glutamyltranspeptidase/glutathione hydrolase